jgi:hypothetical protein
MGNVNKDWEGGFVRLRVAIGVFGNFEDTMVSGAWDKDP